jgi:hypothetical protein
MSNYHFWQNIQKYEGFQGLKTPITTIHIHFLTVNFKYINLLKPNDYVMDQQV